MTAEEKEVNVRKKKQTMTVKIKNGTDLITKMRV